MIYQKQRDYRRASLEFEIATRLVPSMSQAWNLLGLCRTSQGEIELGMRDYNEAVRLSPGLRDAWMNMGQVLKEARCPACDFEDILMKDGWRGRGW
jgi:cytochrome c-type biogenesis protein CcmH/NrfG